jgi:hypothetical protein
MFALAACVSPGAPVLGVLSSSSPAAEPSAVGPVASAAASQAPSALWPGGTAILGGDRYATSDAGVAWIVSKPTNNNELALTQLGLANGASTTRVISSDTPFVSGVEGLAADQAGDLWLSYGDRILEINEGSGTIKPWPLPAPASDALPSAEDPTAGTVYTDAWDGKANSLLLVRDGDHRIYSFDPADGDVSTLTNLPVQTSPASQIVVGSGGSIAVTGQEIGASSTTPSVAIQPVDAGSATLESNVRAICLGPAGFVLVNPSGVVSVASPQVTTVGQLDLGSRYLPIACDDLGNVFNVGYAAGQDPSREQLSVVRLASSGQQADLQLDVRTEMAEGFLPGMTPYPSWSNPDPQALLPDGQGGVWLVTPAGQDAGTPYPSLWHAIFSP